MAMTNQVVNSVKDAGAPPAMLLMDMDVEAEVAPDASGTPETPQMSVGESIALDGGSPPNWLLAEVNGQEDEGSIETLGPAESVELSSAEAAPAGAAPDLSEFGDGDAEVAGAEVTGTEEYS